MSADRHELLRRGYEAVSERDFAAVAEQVDPEFEFEPGESSLLAGGVYRGREGLMRALAESSDAFERVRYTPERFVDSGDERVVVLLRIVSRPRGSSVDLNIQIAHLWRFDGDSPVHAKVYVRPEDAFEAVGLPPERLPGV